MTNSITCLSRHSSGRLAAASPVHRHDAERVLGVRAEMLNLSGGGEHRVLSEEAVAVLNTYDVMCRPSFQVELCHQGPAVLRLHSSDGGHHVKG